MVKLFKYNNPHVHGMIYLLPILENGFLNQQIRQLFEEIHFNINKDRYTVNLF